MSHETTSDVLHHIIDHAHRDGGNIAIKDAATALTYAQLVDRSQRVGAGFAALGATEGDRIVLLLQNSIDYVTAALGSLWVGAIFVPLDATDPSARLASLIRDCQPTVVITNGVVNVEGLSDDLDTSIFATMSEVVEGATQSVGALPVHERASYIIYTSGTTGAPKGVTIGSYAFEAAVVSACQALGLSPATRTLSVSPFHFDGSFGTLFTTLVSGGTLVLRSRDSLLFPRVFFNTIISESITYTGFSPSYLRGLESDPQFHLIATSELSVIALGGEACSVGDVEGIWSVAPHIRVFNRYGPTEATIAATHFEVTREIASRGIVPIGKPHRGLEFHLIDEEGNLVGEKGVAGELYIGGRQLMDGYWNARELSEKVLRTDVVPGRRLYRTGDIVYLDSDDNYVYVDRVDRVIKRRGIRISLLEIADAFRSMEHVVVATSIAFDNDDAVGIAVFVVTDSEIPRSELYRNSRGVLPASMIPDHIEVVTSIPMTSSGKMDNARLLSDAGLQPLRSTAPLNDVSGPPD
jgi:amino acid adenylation domain-containing protein